MIAILCALHGSLAGLVCAEEPGVVASLRQLTGESLHYGIDFLFFTRLAEGELSFHETERPKVYRAELVGRTLGIASWLAGDRTQTYTSLMQLMPDGSLNSIEYTSKIRKKRWGDWQHRGKIRRFDYPRRTILEERLKQGAVSSRAEYEIPGEQRPVDMLTAFYNLRVGNYGPLERGSTLRIPTFSGKGFNDIEVTVLSVEDQARHKAFPQHGLLLQARIDPEVFETGSGRLFVWFDDRMRPGQGILEDLIGLGDVTGYLEKESP